MTDNLDLINQKEEKVPEEFDGKLDCISLALCCSFNRYGTLLAVGCNDGRIVIWDFLTRGIARNIQSHAGHPVSSISWSRNNKKLVSGSVDNSIAIWQVLSGECKIRWTHKAPIFKVQFNPRNENIVLVCPVKQSPILLGIDYTKKEIQRLILPTDKDDCLDANMVASFDRRGQYIYSGNAKGRITIFECPNSIREDVTLDVVSSFRIQPTTAIREIEFGTKNKDYFLVNSSDRTIRLFSCKSAIEGGINGSCEEIRKFQDMVNKTTWKRCCFSGDKKASHVCGGSARQHSIYIFDTENGMIKKMLSGTKGELLLDVQWHPLKPIVASISSGTVSIWARAEIENWSAYAPEFKELDDNLDYDERESEFDLEDEDNKPPPAKEEENAEEELIDVEEITKDDYPVSSDEDGVYDQSTLIYIPISLEDHEMVESAQTH